jgi:hypothetical protein
MKRLFAVFAFSALAALAADITGTWKATADFGNGPIERTFTFKQDGSKLTGKTVSSMMGESAITDGKVDGDTVTFNITGKFGDQEMKLSYSGKINGNEIKLKSEVQGGGGGGNGPIEWTAKKQ